MAAQQALINGEEARQAIDSLGGYSYQLLATVLAWLRLKAGETLYVEVAEDYAVAAATALTCVQVKRTQGLVTLNTPAIRQAIESFVALRELNKGRHVSFRYLTTASDGVENKKADRIQGIGGLSYWRGVRCAADVPPLRTRLLKTGLNAETVTFINARDDTALLCDLINSITWEFDQPSHPSLRQTVDDAFVEFGAPSGLPVQVCENMAAGAVAHVLNISCHPGRRTLSYADFRRHYDRYATVPVSIGSLFNAKLTPGASNDTAPIDVSAILDRLGDVPFPPYVASRQNLSAAICARLQSAGGVWLSAGTGYGKSLLARRCATMAGGVWKIARLRSTDHLQLPSALRRIVAEIAMAPPAGVIIDDLDGFAIPEVREGLASLLLYCRQLGVRTIITANIKPSSELSAAIGFSASDLIGVGELAPEEIGEIITMAGGVSEQWERYVALVTGGGHPQLVHALVFDLKQRDWPNAELQTLSALTGQSSGIEETKINIRQRLVLELNEPARKLLYRLSVAIGAFDRSLMFAIAGVDPVLDNPGELLERMVGPWIDQTRLDEYRLSPLVSNSGQMVLAPEELVRLNFTCAGHLTSQSSLDGSKFDAIVLHGLLGKNREALTTLCIASLRVGIQKLERIGRVCTFTSFVPHRPIYPDDPVLAVQLRTVQLLMCLSVKHSSTGAVWSSLQDEFVAVGQADQRRLQCLALSKMLLAPGAADLISDLTPHFITLHHLCKELGVSIEMPGELDGKPLVAASMLFCFQMTEAETMPGLFSLLNGFCDLPADQRAILCDAFDQPEFDVSTAIKSAWAHSEKQANFDPQSAFDGYLAVAERLASIGAHDMAQAAIETAAATADEYLKESQCALSVLERGVHLFGRTHGLERARSRILFGLGQYEAFLQIAEPFMTDVETQDVVSRAFVSRDVGIARARLGDWSGAIAAFSIGENAANEATGGNLRLMATGFAADISVAQWLGGDRRNAVRSMDRALHLLEHIDPAAGFREMAVYRLIGNSVNHFFLNTGDTSRLVSRIDSYVFAGCNSNPKPHEGLGEGPLGHIDALWYLLADVEVQVGPDRSIADRVLSWPLDRRLLTLGPMLVWKRWRAGLNSMNVPDLLSIAETMLDTVWFIQNRKEVLRSENLANPLRGAIPTVRAEDLPEARSYIEDSVVLLATWLFLNDRVDDGITLLDGLASSARSALRPEVRDTILRESAIAEVGLPSLAEACRHIRVSVTGAGSASMEQVYAVGLRYLEASSHDGGGYIASSVLAWSARQWSSLIHIQRFRLRNPAMAVPSIEAALKKLPKGRPGLATLLLEVLPFAPFTLEPEIVRSLVNVSQENDG